MVIIVVLVLSRLILFNVKVTVVENAKPSLIVFLETLMTIALAESLSTQRQRADVLHLCAEAGVGTAIVF